MRTALSVAALAAGALAVPYKRDVIYTDYDIVYVTDVVTVTAGQAPAAYTSASSSSEASIAQHYGHHNHPQQSVWTSAWATTWTEAVSAPTSTSTPAPAYTPSTTSTAAPAYTPPPSSTPEPEPETSSAPATTSTPVYQIPLTNYVPIPSSSSAVPKSSAAPYSGGGGDVDPTYQKNVLDSHNLHRSNHSASDIDWDHDLWLIAQSTAQTCRYEHNTTAGGGGYGQNIAAGVDGASIVNVITDMFYNGEEWQFADAGNYGKANPDMSKFEAWGHFTQVVWKDSTHVACYTSDADDCPNGLSSLNPDTNEYEPLAGDIPPFFTVCNYKNPGNYGGEYADNVGKPLGQPISYAPSS